MVEILETKMKQVITYLGVVILCQVLGFCLGILYWASKPVSFYHTLGFRPVCSTSSPVKIQAAQAELCRLGCDIGPDGVDGKWGKNSALAFCKLVTDLENRARRLKETKNGQKRTSQNHSL